MTRVYLRQEVCIGCGLCRVYCQTEHSRSKDIIRAFKWETPLPLPRIRIERKDEICLAIQCHHCIEPWCVYSCLTGALHRDPTNGAVVVDSEKCIGCWTCMMACPFGALVKDTEESIVAKCDLCPGRVTPVCVVNCPNEALVLIDEGDRP